MTILASAQEPLRQPDVFERTLTLSTEILLLADAFHEAATKLEVARVAKSIEGMQIAFADIKKFVKQAGMLNEILQRAINHHLLTGAEYE
jgi:uncharacterized protein YllA (UPF0747 family)